MIQIIKAKELDIRRKARKESPQKKAIRKLKVGECFITLKSKEQNLRGFIRKNDLGYFSFLTQKGGRVAVVRNG